MSDKSEDDVESNRVLEYYKKYSRNPDLSKYFTGPEAALIKKPSTSRQTYREPQERSNIFTHVQVETTINIENSIVSDVNQDVDIENKNVSPTSSIASHKKLEWDNGADIGYTNSYKLSTKKSASFPSLFPSLKTNNKLNSQNEEKSISENIEDLRNMYHQLTFSSEMSCSPPKDSAVTSSSTSPPKVELSSDSSTQSDPKKLTSSSDSSNQIAYLQKRIGIPVANSTPNEENLKSGDLYTETPLLRAQTKPKRNLNIENTGTSETTDSQSEKLVKNSRTDDHSSSSKGGNEKLVQKLTRVQREINLCLTKPVSLECISQENKECANKLSQTSFSSVLPTKCVQTDIVEPEKVIIHPDPINVCSPQTLKIEYVKYDCDGSSGGSTSLRCDESDMSNVKSSRKNRRKGKSNDKMEDIEKETVENVKDVVNMSNDKGIDDADQRRKVGDSKGAQVESSTCSSASKRSDSDSVRSTSERSKKSIDPKSVPVNESCEEENVLAEMISLNHSRDLNTDIKRSIDILQKLLKSKKYDRSTKKYYIKKIVQKIVESKYSDDSTTSSELFRPRKSNFDKVTTQIINRNVQNDVKLMDNIPWYPADHTKFNLKKRAKPIECKTTRTEVFNTQKHFTNTQKPSPKHDLDSRTAKSDQQILIRAEKESFKRTSTSQDTQSSDVFVYKKTNDEPSTSLRQDQNWRNGKTCSEMLLEKRDKGGSKLGQGDYLLHVAKNERQHQLSWINNEIEHLVNLKTLLEKKQKPDPQLKEVISSLLKMKVEDMKGISKNLEVFVCKCIESKGKCDCIRGIKKNTLKAKTKKKSASLTPGYYTIETQLDPNGNLMDLTVFDEKGIKKYNYRNDGEIEDVEVTSKNHNTAVKLKPKPEIHAGYPTQSPYKMCRDCGRLFLPSMNNPDLCVCDECFASNPEQNYHYPDRNKQQPCEICGNLFEPPEDNPTSICPPCCLKQENDETESNSQKICENCGQSFRPSEQTTKLCLCENCCKSQLEQVRLRKSQQNVGRICKECGNHFLPSKTRQQQDMCKYCKQKSLKNAQKVTFSEPLESGLCNRECTKDNIVNHSVFNQFDTLPTTIYRQESCICPGCHRKLNECVCHLKFMPKPPRLVGDESDEDIPDAYGFGGGTNRKKTCKLRPYPGTIRQQESCLCKIDQHSIQLDDFENDSDLSVDRKGPMRVCFNDDEVGMDEGRGGPCEHCISVQANTKPRSKSKQLKTIPCPIYQTNDTKRTCVCKNKATQSRKPESNSCSHCAKNDEEIPPRSRSASPKLQVTVPCPSSLRSEKKRTCLCKNNATQCGRPQRDNTPPQKLIPCPSFDDVPSRPLKQKRLCLCKDSTAQYERPKERFRSVSPTPKLKTTVPCPSFQTNGLESSDASSESLKQKRSRLCRNSKTQYENPGDLECLCSDINDKLSISNGSLSSPRSKTVPCPSFQTSESNIRKRSPGSPTKRRTCLCKDNKTQYEQPRSRACSHCLELEKKSARSRSSSPELDSTIPCPSFRKMSPGSMSAKKLTCVCEDDAAEYEELLPCSDYSSEESLRDRSASQSSADSSSFGKGKRHGRPCSHCVSLQTNRNGSNKKRLKSSKSKTSRRRSRGSSSKRNRSCLCKKDDESQDKETNKKSYVRCPSVASSRESVAHRRPSKSASQIQAKEDPCCSCNASNQKTELSSSRSQKKCQCCMCTNCAIQTKKSGDNARCPCCICENCAIQVTLDKDGKPRKPILSKWCRPQSTRPKKKKKDELDCSDDSLQSISSENIICITPTKYKCTRKQKPSAECQCSMSNRNNGKPERSKSMQICPSLMKVICNNNSTNSTGQDRSTKFNCPPCSQSSPDKNGSCESLDYPCKPLKPKIKFQESTSDVSLTCPAKKATCPAKPPLCPGVGNKPCPVITPKPCPGRKPPPCEEQKSESKEKAKSKGSCPGKEKCPNKNPPPCPGRKKSKEKDNYCLSITMDSPFQEARNSLEKSGATSGDKEVPSLDEVPSLEQDSSKSPKSPPELLHGKGPPFGSYNQDKVQVFMCPTATNDPLKDSTPPRNCLCQSDTCKCSQTATHEEKNIQCPAFKPCTCQTEQKEDAKIQCCCKGRD